MKLKILNIFVIILLFNGLSKGQDIQITSLGNSFIENKGQVVDLNYQPNPSVLYLYNSNGLNIHLKKSGFSYDVYSQEILKKVNLSERENSLPEKLKLPEDSINWYFQRIDIQLVNSNPNVFIEAKGKSEDYTNYYTGQTKNSEVLYVYQYKEVYYHNIYNNIDLQFIIEGNKAKYNFILNSGADINDILLNFSGYDDISLNENNEISLVTKQGNVIESIPNSYYQADKKAVAIKFILKGDGLFGFTGEFNSTKTMVIDPSPERVWSTYFGGGSEDIANRVGVDKEGNPLICGYATSLTNIASSGHQNFLAGSKDAFIAKFNDSGSRIWATYYGGNTVYGIEDIGQSVAADNDNNVYLAGLTISTDNIGYKGYRDTLYSPNYFDAFLVKFNKNGVRLWGTYYGGSKDDWGYAVCTDKLGSVYMAGETRSNNNISFNGYQNTFGSTSSGIGDGFLVKFDSSGNRVWATYFGGPNHEKISAACTDVNNNILIAGYTLSTSGIYFNGHQNYFAGTSDGLAAKFSPTGTLLWSTYYGGTSSDEVNDITTDKDSNVYIVGTTTSSTNIAYNGPDDVVAKADAFLVKFTANGTREMGTYHGSSSTLTNEEGTAVSVDSSGNIFITGYGELLNSTTKEDIFLVKYRFQKYNSKYVVDKVGYFAGTKQDYSYGLATYNNTLYMTGGTYSTSMAASSSLSSIHQASSGGILDAFLMRFEPATIQISNVPSGPFCYGDTFSIDYKYIGTLPLQSGNEFKVYSYDSLGNFSTKLGSLKTTNSAGKILVTILDVNKKAYSLRVWASSPEIYGDFSDTFTIKNKANIFFNIKNYWNGDTVKCLKGNIFFFDLNIGTKTDTNGVDKHVWDFGDGDSSLVWQPTKSFSSAGVYNIKLKTYTTAYACSSNYAQTVYVRPNPKASFTISNPSVCEKDTITYTNTSFSSGEPLYYTWTLAGSYIKGTSSTTKDAIQYYPSEYSFNAKLITRNSYGCADTTPQTLVKASKYPTAGFLLDSLKPCLNGNKVLLTNQTSVSTSLPKNVSYLWDFGDGKTSTAYSPLKSYDSVGQKKIKLTATNNGSCSNTFSRTLNIQPNPIADFEINNDTQCFNEHQFVFTNKSQSPNSGAITSLWKVGSVTSTLSSPTFKFNSAGNYTALLTVKTTIGCSDSVTKNVVVNPSPKPIINGAITAKGKKQGIYTTIPNTGSTYVWSVSGGTIISGQNTSQVTVMWNENTGSVGLVFLIETSLFGCDGTPTVLVVNLDPSSINGVENIHNISLYPNPTANDLTIDIGNYTDTYTVTVYNNLGQAVTYKTELVDNNLLSLSELANGVYFVQIEGKNFSYRQKLVVQKQ
jgi:PKD repeat protein